ncbi:hypothetical protein R6Q59_027240 [Mikania micrantha]
MTPSTRRKPTLGKPPSSASAIFALAKTRTQDLSLGKSRGYHWAISPLVITNNN